MGKINSLRKRLRWATQDILFAAGAGNHLLRSMPGKRIVVYHGVDHRGNTRLNNRFISQKRLAYELAWFRRHCHVVDLEQLLREPPHPEKLTIAITFDDGYANNFDLALPVLESHDTPATFFVCTAHLHGQDALWTDLVDLGLLLGKWADKAELHRSMSQLEGEGFDHEWTRLRAKFSASEMASFRLYWDLMSPEMIAACASHPLITIGGHGVRHLFLDKISPSACLEELSQNHQELTRLTGKDIRHVAFPFGNGSGATVLAAQQAGFATCLFMDLPAQGLEDHQGQVAARIGHNPIASPLNTISSILKGTYD